ncbi:MAG: hypothetical protein MR489_06570 [Prevotella sp.]|nr:hypothetical protein [Prevotella sp.]
MKGKQFRKSAAPLRDILHGDISKWGTAALSQTVFYVLIAIATLLFALFYVVGYNQPYDENPDINAPLFTGAVIWFMLATTAIAAAVCVVSGVKTTRINRHKKQAENGVPARRIATTVTLATIAVMAATFTLIPATPITANSTAYTDGFWLRATEMFVDTSLLLLVAAVAAMGYSRFRSTHNDRKGGRQC